MRRPPRSAQRIATVAGALVLAAAGMVATSTTAHAASYNGVCGAGYGVVESAAIGDAGTLFLTWNGSTGKNCAVAVRNAPGAAIWMEVWVSRTADGGGDVDNGYFTSYAGPVYVSGRNTCIAFSGTIGSQSVTRGPGHCG
ncbi:spore-associated protein A [Streptomyces sp. LZ34]